MKTRSYLILTTAAVILGTSFDVVLIATEPSFKAPSDREPSINALYDPPTCGPAVAALVLRLYGKSYRTEDICRGTYVDSQGNSTVASICNTLSNYGVYARGCKLSVNELLKRHTPTIIFVENYGDRKGRNHFVLYVGHDADYIKLIDPLYKPLQKTHRDKFEQKWQNVAIITQLSPFTGLKRKIHWTIAMFVSLFLLVSTSGLICIKLHR